MLTSTIRNTLTPVAGLLAAMLLFSGCSDSSSSDSDEFEDGVRIEILDILGEENLEILENDLEMPIHRGQNPPDLLAYYNSVALNNKNVNAGVSFVIQPLIMIESVVPDESRDPDSFWDLYIQFSDQDMDDYSILFENRHVQEPTGTAIASYIIGEDDEFTIAGEVVREREEGTSRTAQVFSGQLHEDGIAITHFAFIMIDNDDIEGLIPNGTGRTFIDGSGISEFADYPEEDENAQVKGDEPGSAFWDIFKK